MISPRPAAPRIPRGAALRAAASLGLILGLAVLAGCAYRGGIDQPVTLKATWFSYLNGDDIRSACVPGAPPKYRLVYNGNYDEQLRAYELVGEYKRGTWFTVQDGVVREKQASYS